MYKQNQQNNKNLLIELDNYKHEIVSIVEQNIEKMKMQCNDQSEMKAKMIDKLRDINESE